MQNTLDDKSGFEVLGIVVVIFLSTPVHGWVVSCLWNWFLVPWMGFPELTIPLATGVVLLMGFMSNSNGNFDFKWSSLIARGYVVPPLFVFVGWIVHSFLA